MQLRFSETKCLVSPQTPDEKSATEKQPLALHQGEELGSGCFGTKLRSAESRLRLFPRIVWVCQEARL